MRNILLILCCLLLPLTASQAQSTRDPYQYLFDTTLGDFSEELQLAKEQDKKGILIFFEMDECPFCHWMKQNVLNQIDVQEKFKKDFLIYSVDIEGDIEITDFKGKLTTQKDFAFKQNRVRATPVFAFFNLEGDRIFRFTGKTSGVDEFMLMHDYIVNDIYQEQSFTRYKRAQRKAQ